MKSEDIGRAWNKLSKEEKESWKERSRTLDVEHDGRLYEQLQSPRKKRNSKRQTRSEDMEVDDEDPEDHIKLPAGTYVLPLSMRIPCSDKL